MRNSRLEKLWDGVQSLRWLGHMDMGGSIKLIDVPDLSTATNLMTLNLSGCENLVKLPSSTGHLRKLKQLNIANCTNLKILPNGINLESLYKLDLCGCSRFHLFPDISRNISFLFLSQTAIEEVPWWIENFSKLKSLEMWECKELKYIFPNISKLKLLEKADFSNCEALTEASLLEHPRSEATTSENTHTKLPVLSFINCFHLDQEALIQQSVFKYIILPGGQVPSYFTNRATGSSLAIRLYQSSLSQQFLRFRVCLVVDADKPNHTGNAPITNSWICCHFTCKDGNSAECRIDIDLPRQIDNHLVISDCRFPLSKENGPLLELNYDQLDTEFHFTSDSLCKIKECGIRLSEVCPLPENRRGNLSVLPRVWEDDESQADSGLSNETEHGEETERSRKRIKIK